MSGSSPGSSSAGRSFCSFFSCRRRASLSCCRCCLAISFWRFLNVDPDRLATADSPHARPRPTGARDFGNHRFPPADQRLRFLARTPRRLPPSFRNRGPAGGRLSPKREPPEGRGPLLSERSRASLTLMFLPRRSLPLSSAMARCASSSEPISTKPKPRERPVIRSLITEAISHAPAFENVSFRSSSEVSKERLPTKSFRPMSPSDRADVSGGRALLPIDDVEVHRLAL